MKKIPFFATFFAVILCSYIRAQDPGMDLQVAREHNGRPGWESGEVTAALRAAVRESNALYGQSFIKGDSSLFAERYDTNAWIMPPNSPVLEGPMAASTFFTIAYHQMNIRNVVLTTRELYAQDNFATEVGSFELQDIHRKVLNKGKYVVLWKCTNGKWKMYRDCFNSDSK